MKPYYEHGGITIYLGDCRDVLADWMSLAAPVAGGSVDLLLADPPYGDTSLAWDERDLSWLRAAGPTVRDAGSVWCFGSLRMFMAQADQIAALGWRVSQDLVWEKQNGSGFHTDRFRRVHEHALHLYRSTARWEDVYKAPVTTADATARTVRRKTRPTHTGNIGDSAYVSRDGGPRLMRSVVYARNCHGSADHPTQKPLGILRPLISYSCPVGGLILDPTMGAGSTLVAAREMRRRAVGIEIDERFCEAAARRLSQGVLALGEERSE